MAPLLASQVFDRAQANAVTQGEGAPLSVSVWIIEPMRTLFRKSTYEKIRELKLRASNVSIRIFGGINRLGDWPCVPHMQLERRLKGSAPVIYHCRGEASFLWGQRLIKNNKKDKSVYDIRGYLPLERLAFKGVFNLEDLSTEEKQQYQADLALVNNYVQQADGAFTVSESLRAAVISTVTTPKANDIVVVPCCVSGTTDDKKRDAIRAELGISDKTAILYLGGTQKYQHLEDLVLPYIKTVLALSDKHIAIFISQSEAKIRDIIGRFDIPEGRYKLINLPQAQVQDYLSAMDAGLLLRAPSIVNASAQPVKVGEYLSAGLPIIFHEGTGDLSTLLVPRNIGYAVDLVNETKFTSEVSKSLVWLEMDKANRRQQARMFINEQYTWQANLAKERKLYLRTIN
jgi:glycosyltransferase involved in cell wall biosynthesis